MNSRSYIKNLTMELEKALKLLADKNRHDIVNSLKNGEVCVCDMAESLKIEQSLLSHHLRKLKSAGFVNERKLGRWVHYSLNVEEFKKLEDSFIKSFGSSNISTKKCELHEECCSSGKC